VHSSDCLEPVCNSVCGFQATYKALIIALAKLQNKNGPTKVCFHNSRLSAYFFYAHTIKLLMFMGHWQHFSA